ncbi:MAG: hypothetical protein GTN49_01605 [candidate division Zixibacteria bacterium]|nr:hypothetical protein [candidate division Zixibacteria bacterium]
MKLGKVLLVGTACLIALAGCRRGEEGAAESAAPGEGYTPPPVEYVVGKMDVDDDAAEPSVRMNIAVDPSTSAKDVKRLLDYFDKDRYDDYDIVWVNVYFDVAKARSPQVDTDALVATLRVNRPGFREMEISEDLVGLGGPLGGQPEVTSRSEETLYLGRRGRMFDSGKQAQVLVDLMEEKPGHAIYRVVWQSPENTELTYGLEQKMLVRVRKGVSRETWADMSFEELKRAARGAGFGGRRRHGANYTYVPEAGNETGPAGG